MTTDPQQLPAHWSQALKDAFWTAVNAPTYDESTAATLAFAHLLADHAAPVPSDRADLRDRIASMLAAADGWTWTPDFDRTLSPVWQGYLKRADAVLAVSPPADRVAVLLEAEQHLRMLAEHAQHGVWLGMRAAADEMGRLAAEAQQPGIETRDALMRAHVALAEQAGRDQAAIGRVLDWVATLDALAVQVHGPGTRHPVADHVRGLLDAAPATRPAAEARQDAPTVPVQPAAEAPWPHTMLGAAEVEEKPDLNITPLPAGALVADETVEEPAADGSSEETCDGCGHPPHPADQCQNFTFNERCECDEPIAVDRPSLLRDCECGGSTPHPDCPVHAAETEPRP